MSRSGNYLMLTQELEKMKQEGQPVSIRELSRRTGLSRNTITKYLKDGFQQHAAKGIHKGSLLDDYKPWLQSQFKAGNYNSASLYTKLQEKGYQGGLSILKDYIKKFRPPVVRTTQQRTMRYETSTGKQVQMDWGFVRYINRNGKEKHYACLVMILGYSRKKYIEFFSQATLEFLRIGMIHAFQYFGGVPEQVLTDNMKSVVQSRTRKSITFNPRFETFAAEMGFTIKVCKIRCPMTKGKAERLVHYVKNNFMPGREFENLVDLNVQALQWCSTVDGLEHGTTGRIPNEALKDEILNVLPPMDVLDRYLWSERSVGIDGSVSFEGIKLGVDCSCHSKRVFVAREDNRVMVADKSGMIVGEYLLEGRRKNYFHPNQWPSDYRSYSQKPQKAYSPGRQVDFLLEPDVNLSEYDQLAGRF